MAGGIHCGIRKNKAKPDLAMIYSETPYNAAAVYTTNPSKGAHPGDEENLADSKAKAVITNSDGQHSTLTGRKAGKMCRIATEVSGIEPQDVIVASTGVGSAKCFPSNPSRMRPRR